MVEVYLNRVISEIKLRPVALLEHLVMALSLETPVARFASFNVFSRLNENLHFLKDDFPQ